MGITEYIFIICFFGIPAVTGAVLAHRRKKIPCCGDFCLHRFRFLFSSSGFRSLITKYPAPFASVPTVAASIPGGQLPAVIVALLTKQAEMSYR